MNPVPPYWRLSAYYLAYFAFLGAFAPYFGLFLKEQGVSAWYIAVLLSQMQLMRILAPVAWGWIADHSGRPVAIVRASAVLSLLGMVAFFQGQTMVLWFVAIAVMAFFWSAALPLVEVVTLRHLGAAGASYTRIRLWGSIGFIAAVILLGRAIEYRSLAILPGVLLALLSGVVIAAFALPRDQKPHGFARGSSIGSILRQGRVRRMLMACFCMSLAHGALYVFYSIHLAAAGYTATTIGVLWSLGVLAEIAVFWSSHRLLHGASPRVLLAGCLIAAAIRFSLIGWGAENLVVLTIAQLLHGLTFGAFHAVSIAAIHRWFPGGSASRGQALYSSISFGAGGFVGGLASGAIWDALGGALTFSLSSLFALLGFFIVIAPRVVLRLAARARFRP